MDREDREDCLDREDLLECFILFFILFFLSFYDKNMNSVIILDHKRAWRVLSRNRSYYHSFTELDLMARGVASLDEYLRRIREDIADPSPAEQRLLERNAAEADRRFLRLPEGAGIDGSRAARLPWQLILMKGKRYENGFPHTIPGVHGGYIVLFRGQLRGAGLLGTMIHEKTHIYQRRYQKEMDALIRRHFILVGKRVGRANPDTDGLVWQHRWSGKDYQTTWRTSRPRSLSDVSGRSEQEHPLEEMAYWVERKLVK